MRYIVEVVVCAVDEDGKRWRADGCVVGEFDDRPLAAQVVADKLETFARGVLFALVRKTRRRRLEK